MHTVSQQSSLSDGEALSFGGLLWPRPYVPARVERATLVHSALPAWAIPSGTTAAWIWTGMGLPTPLTVLRPSSPAISPLVREYWKARELLESRHHVTTVGGYTVLDPLSTERDLFTHDDSIDSCATQILFLRALTHPSRPLGALRLSPTQRERMAVIEERIARLQRRYPDITR